MSARYRLRRRLGRGGMAEVFEATATGERGFERRVALKRMLPEIGRAHENMFLDEARIASHLHHANIVAVLDYGLADQRPFQVLEFIEGLDLQRALDLAAQLDAPLPVEVALHLCTEVAHALSHAHAARGPDGQPLGIVHRDVKPGNVLVSYDGDVKLGDFGIAFARDRLERTEVGIAKGTRAYMSPEQLMAGEVDGRSDLFSLGCVLHALLTGESPMTEGSAQELLEGQELTLHPSLPEDLTPLIARAVRRQKRDRYPTAAELAAELGDALMRRVAQPGKALTLAWMARLRPLAEQSRDQTPAGDLALDLAVASTQAAPPARPRTARNLGLAAIALLAVAGLAAAGLYRSLAPEQKAGPTASPNPNSSTAAAAPPTAASPTGSLPTAAPLTGSLPTAASPTGSLPTAAAPPGVPRSSASPPTRGAAATGVAPVARAGSSRVRNAQPPAARSPTVAAVDAEAVVAPRGSGHLLVGGEGALRAEIFIDGKSNGFAPRLLELPAGPHEVELTLASGGRLHKRVSLSESHTQSSPIRWLVP